MSGKAKVIRRFGTGVPIFPVFPLTGWALSVIRRGNARRIQRVNDVDNFWKESRDGKDIPGRNAKIFACRGKKGALLRLMRKRDRAEQEQRMTSEEFSAYFRQKGPRLRGLARRQLHGEEAVEEAVQQLFVRLVPHYSKIDPRHPDGYVLAALSHVICDVWRRNNQQEGWSDEMAAILADPNSDLNPDEEDASIAECEALVHEVIGELTSPQRVALRASLLFDREQAMQHVGPGYDGALNRARAHLRERLGHRPGVVYRLGAQRLTELLAEQPELGMEAVQGNLP
jgi:DNA-directed RNA polymerase specialized sigma24 family protein